MKKNCSNYPTSLHINDKDKKWYCGEDYLFKSTTTYSDSDDLTYIINGDDLKKQTEKIFGKGEYQGALWRIFGQPCSDCSRH